MADNENVNIKFDLDTKEAIEKLLQLREGVLKVGEQENLAGLVSGLTKVGAAAGTIGVAYLALKTTMDLVFEGENIKAINQQFEMLTKNAGIAGDALKEAMVKASGGLIDDTDLMKAANMAIVEMGDSASKLPELLELSRKAASVFGGTVQERFEAMNSAIATGNMRQLKHMGIIVDVDKATKAYATSLGVSENALSQSGKQQALLNAVIAQGHQSLDGVNVNLKENQNLWQSIKVSLSEIKEAFVVVFEKTVGPSLASFLKNVKESATGFKTLVTSMGDGSEAAKAKVEILEGKVKDLNKELEGVKKGDQGFFDKLFGVSKEAQINSITNAIKKTEAEIKSLEATSAKAEKTGTPGGAKGGRSKTDEKKLKEEESKFQSDITKIQAEQVGLRKKLVTDQAAFDKLKQDQLVLIHKQAVDKIAKIEKEYATQEAKRDQLIALEKENEELKITQVKEDQAKERLLIAENTARIEKENIAGVGAGFKLQMEKDKAELADFSAKGQWAYDSMKSVATTAFTNIGAGSKDTAAQMEKAFLGAIATQAIAQGSLMFMSSVWPPQPPGLIGGAALMAFGGALQAKVGSMGGGVSASAASAGSSDMSSVLQDSGGTGSSSAHAQSATEREHDRMAQEEMRNLERNDRADDREAMKAMKAEERAQAIADKRQAKLDAIHGAPMSDATTPDVTKFAAPKKQVTIQVQGHYFETEQTRTKLMEMMRESTDATDFKYVQIGQR